MATVLPRQRPPQKSVKKDNGWTLILDTLLDLLIYFLDKAIEILGETLKITQRM